MNAGYTVKLLIIGIIAGFAASGCRPEQKPGPIQPTGIVAPGGTVSPTSSNEPPGNKSSPDVLSACRLEDQAKAMRADYQPEWDSLGIDTCYDLSFDLTSGGPDFSGSARITYTNPEDTALDEIILRTYPNADVLYGGTLQVTSAGTNGTELSPQTFLDDQTAVRLQLAEPLQPGATIELDLKFSGGLPRDFNSQQIYGTYHYASDGPLLVMANAFPMLALRQDGIWRTDPVLAEGDAVISRTALYLAEIRLPNGWQAAASGTVVNESEDQGDRVLQVAGGALRDFMLVASPALSLHQEDWQDMQINHWATEVVEDDWVDAVPVVRDSLELFNQTFGPLPYRELDIVAVPLNNASGVEYPGLILLAEDLYTSKDIPRLLPTVTAHEVAHQWWYAVVGNDVIEHPWQDEGLATFSAQFYSSQYDPAFYQGARLDYNRRVEMLETASGHQPVDQSVSDFSDNPRDYATVVYLKGSLFFEALRSQIGDAAFNTGLADYYRENLHGLAAPQSLLTSFVSACSCNLDELYSEWGVQP